MAYYPILIELEKLPRERLVRLAMVCGFSMHDAEQAGNQSIGRLRTLIVNHIRARNTPDIPVYERGLLAPWDNDCDSDLLQHFLATEIRIAKERVKTKPVAGRMYRTRKLTLRK